MVVDLLVYFIGGLLACGAYDCVRWLVAHKR